MKYIGTDFSGFSATTKFSDLFRITIGNTAANDQIEITATATNDNLTDVDVFMAANSAGVGVTPWNTSNGNTAGTGAQNSGGITTSTARTITFTGLSAGGDGINVRLKSVHDGTTNAFGTQEKDITITAVVKDSGGSTVVSSTTMHTVKVTHQPGA